MTDIKVCFAGGVDFIQKGKDFLRGWGGRWFYCWSR